MKKTTLVLLAIISFGFINTASADDIKKMIGKWQWKGFTVEVVSCKATEVCATVTKGPKNVGLKMIRSKLKLKNKNFYGKVAHPETGAIYNTRITMKNNDTWSLNGCTDKKVCASGEFTRIK